MGLTIRSAPRGGAIGVVAILACLAPPRPAVGATQNAAHCSCGHALRAMLETEYAFGQRAKNSVRGAFLEYLADDSVVLNPAPEPGRAVYLATKEDQNKLEWYPTLADVAPSGDLGFTEGPFTFTVAESGKQHHGHFLSVWKRDATCNWRVEFDGGVSHAAPSIAEAKLMPSQAAVHQTESPPPKLVNADAASRAVRDFQQTVKQDGLAAALRTYGRDTDFVFLMDERSPVGIGEASTLLDARTTMGAWRESVRGQSADSTIIYSVGELEDSNDLGTHAYAQIWQFDPKVANWGLRILLLSPLPPPKGK